ncbi:MAG TPA: hypothetical protein VGI86_02310, partial [Acidimicrobiia bacterium]|jgi:hypothetical protein
LAAPAKAKTLTVGSSATLTLQPVASTLTLSVSDSIENDGTIQQGQTPRALPPTSVIAVGAGGFVNRGSFMISAGTARISHMSNSGEIDVAQSATLVVAATTNLQKGVFSGGTWDALGTLRVGGAAGITTVAGTILSVGTDFTDVSGARALTRLRTVAADATLAYDGDLNTDQLTNAGVMEPVGALKTHGDYVQSGTGRTELFGGSITPLTHTFRIAAGGTLTGTGTIVGDVISSGTVNASGPYALNVTGTYAPTSAALTEVVVADVSGTRARLVVGTAKLQGGLFVDTGSDHFAPGNSLAILQCTVCTGTFGTVRGAGYVPSYSSRGIIMRTLQVAEETDPAISFGQWRTVDDATASGGTYHVSGATGDQLTADFSGTSVSWVTRVGPDQGIAAVSIDGVSMGTVDNGAPVTASALRTYTGLADGDHHLTLTVVGVPNSPSRSKNIVFDGLFTDNGVVGDTDPSVVYGVKWEQQHLNDASGGLALVSDQPNTSVTFSFTGTMVQWVTYTNRQGGHAQVSIDGTPVRVINLASATDQPQVLETFDGLTAGAHTITVAVLPGSGGGSSGTVTVDAFAFAG